MAQAVPTSTTSTTPQPNPIQPQPVTTQQLINQTTGQSQPAYIGQGTPWDANNPNNTAGPSTEVAWQYYNAQGQAYDPLRDGLYYYKYNPTDKSWWSGSVGTGGFQLSPDHLANMAWTQNAGPGTAYADLRANPDYQFLQQAHNLIEGNSKPLIKQSGPGVSFEDYYANRQNPNAAAGLTPEQQKIYDNYAHDRWLYDLYETNPTLAQKIAPRPELGPAPDFSKEGYYIGSQYVGTGAGQSLDKDQFAAQYGANFSITTPDGSWPTTPGGSWRQNPDGSFSPMNQAARDWVVQYGGQYAGGGQASGTQTTTGGQQQGGQSGSQSGGGIPTTYNPNDYNANWTDAQMVEWYKNAPGVENVRDGKYYSSDGSIYRPGSGNSYWQDKNSDQWYMGTPSGQISQVAGPPWQQQTGGSQSGSQSGGNQGSQPNQNNQQQPSQPTVYDTRNPQHMQTLRGMTDAERLQYWTQIPGVMDAVKGGTFYAENGQPYRYVGDSYWQDANSGQWFKGRLDGSIEEITGPPWQQQSSNQAQTTLQQLLQQYFGAKMPGGGQQQTGNSNAGNAAQMALVQAQLQQLMQTGDMSDPAVQAQFLQLQQQINALGPAYVPPANGQSGSGMPPGMLTLAMLMNRQSPHSWQQPGTPFGQGYGQQGYGGQNLVSNPFYTVPKR